MRMVLGGLSASGVYNQEWCEGLGRRKEQLYFEGAGLKPLNTNV